MREKFEERDRNNYKVELDGMGEKSKKREEDYK